MLVLNVSVRKTFTLPLDLALQNMEQHVRSIGVIDRPIEFGAKVEASATHAVQIMSDQQRARTMRGGMSGG
jgi:hypothetical protein